MSIYKITLGYGMTLNNTSKATQLMIAKFLAHLNIISKS